MNLQLPAVVDARRLMFCSFAVQRYLLAWPCLMLLELQISSKCSQTFQLAYSNAYRIVHKLTNGPLSPLLCIPSSLPHVHHVVSTSSNSNLSFAGSGKKRGRYCRRGSLPVNLTSSSLPIPNTAIEIISLHILSSPLDCQRRGQGPIGNCQ